MAKKESKSLESLTKAELISKCQNQKETIKRLQAKIEDVSLLERKIGILELAYKDMKIDHKLRICMNETLSLMNDIEKLKQKNRTLGGDE